MAGRLHGDPDRFAPKTITTTTMSAATVEKRRRDFHARGRSSATPNRIPRTPGVIHRSRPSSWISATPTRGTRSKTVSDQGFGAGRAVRHHYRLGRKRERPSGSRFAWKRKRSPPPTRLSLLVPSDRLVGAGMDARIRRRAAAWGGSHIASERSASTGTGPHRRYNGLTAVLSVPRQRPRNRLLHWMPAREREPPGGGRFDEAGDATRRTRLANERTYLAWWRTDLPPSR